MDLTSFHRSTEVPSGEGVTSVSSRWSGSTIYQAHSHFPKACRRVTAARTLIRLSFRRRLQLLRVRFRPTRTLPGQASGCAFPANVWCDSSPRIRSFRTLEPGAPIGPPYQWRESPTVWPNAPAGAEKRSSRQTPLTAAPALPERKSRGYPGRDSTRRIRGPARCRPARKKRREAATDNAMRFFVPQRGSMNLDARTSETSHQRMG